MKSWTVQEFVAMAEQATVDCHNESEKIAGFFTEMDESIHLPFTTTVFGLPIPVQQIDLTQDDQNVAVCRRGRQTQRIRLLDLPLPSPLPEGAEWITAFRYWVRRNSSG